MSNVKQLRVGKDALLAFLNSSKLGGEATRPYVGQRWTLHGERGRQILPPITHRDLGDIIVRALKGLPNSDIEAIAQKICRQIEVETGDVWYTEFKRLQSSEPHKVSEPNLRPANYEELSPREQWEVDKELGILDWDGT